MAFSDYVLLPWIYGPAAALAAVIGLWIVKRRVFSLVTRMAARTSTRMDDILLDAAGSPLNLLILASGLLLLGRLLPMTEEADRALDILYRFFVVGSFVWFVDRLGRGLIGLFAERVPFISQSRGVVQGTVRVAFFAIGILILFDSMGISITPLIASLGVGSLAVALALQPTLANLFAGMQLMADKAVEVGQFVRLEWGEEGHVERIGWRSTRLRLRPNVMLILPNSKLVESRILNYDAPDTETAVTVSSGVHYDSDLSKVETVGLEVAREVIDQVPGGVRGFEPVFRYTAFGDSSITFNVILRVRSYAESPLLVHEFIKRLHDRFRQEGIVIPYPVRTVELPERVLDRLAPASS